MVVAPNQAVRLVAATTTESEQEVYATRGGTRFGGEQTTVDITKTTTRFAIEVDGQTAWAMVTTRKPSSFVTLKEGQSMQAAVDESARGDDAELIQNATLPDLIPDPR